MLHSQNSSKSVSRAITFIVNWAVASIPVVFYASTHASFLPSGPKLLIMQGVFAVAVLAGVPLALLHARRLKSPIPIIFGVVTGIHVLVTSWQHAAMSDYGHDKIRYLLVVIYFGFYYVPYLVGETPKRIVYFIDVLSLVAILFCILNLLPGSAGQENIRKSSIDLNPAIMARMCLIAAGLSFVNYCRPRQQWQILIVLLGVAAAIKTGTRGPLIAFSVAAGYVGFCVLDRRVFLRFTAIAAVLIATTSILLTIVPSEISDRFTLEAVKFEGTDKEGGRGDLFSTAFSILTHHQWGIGFGNFAEHHRFITVPHNLFLEMAVEMSVLFSILFLVYVLESLRRMTSLVLRSGERTDASILFLLVYQLMNAMSGGEATIQSMILYSVCGLAYVRTSVATTERSRVDPTEHSSFMLAD